MGGFSGGYDGYAIAKAQANYTKTYIESTSQEAATFLPDEFYFKKAPKLGVPEYHIRTIDRIVILENMKNQRYITIIPDVNR